MGTIMNRNRLAVVLALNGLVGIASLAAQDAPDPRTADGTYDAGADPGPNRGVARISLLNGDVSVRRGDSKDVVAASLNAPVMVQDSLLTSSSSRAELQFDPGTMLRVGANSEVHVANLDNRNYQLELAIGTITLRVLRADSQAEIDTPSVAVRPLSPGTYRITVRDDGSSEITVREGEAEIASANGTQRLGAAQTMLARGKPQEAEFQTVTASQTDAWDKWNLDRDHAFEGSRSAQYVGPDVPGTEELDNNGRWVADQNYGQVWTPNVVDPNWAPYRNGDWTWEDYYGWTWVSADPWGWAPYHYGRWFHGGAGWCWWPGPIYGRHFWAPAYVGFFGFGGGGFGFGFGNLGWVGLAPYERFHPWWGREWNGRNIFENSRIERNVNIGNFYRNARVGNGITGVAANQFGRRGGNFNSFNGSQVQNAGMVRGIPPIAPGRSSLALSNRVASGNYPQTANQQFFSRGSTTAPSGRSFSGGQPAAGAHDWSRFGSPIHGGSPAIPQQTTGQQNNGWRGFGTAGTPGSATSRGFGGYQPRGMPNSGYTGGNAQPLRISPPIVQQRAPSYNGGGYAAPSYRSPEPSYNGGGRSTPSYSAPSYRPAAPSYNGGGYAAPSYHAPQPSYNGGGRSTPSYSAPSYNGGGYAAPTYRAPQPSYNGGGGRQGPSYSAPSNRSAAPSGGGRAAPSGGGGRAPAGGGSQGGGGHHR